MTDLLITNAALLDVETGTLHDGSSPGSPATGSARLRWGVGSTAWRVTTSSTRTARR